MICHFYVDVYAPDLSRAWGVCQAEGIPVLKDHRIGEVARYTARLKSGAGSSIGVVSSRRAEIFALPNSA
jgi:hypothetical protein